MLGFGSCAPNFDSSAESSLRIVTKDGQGVPVSVRDRRTGLGGRVLYSDAKIVEVSNPNDDTGRFAIPVRSSTGALYYLTWSFEGEFDRFTGLREHN